MSSAQQRVVFVLAVWATGHMLHAQTGNIGISKNGQAPDPTAILDIYNDPAFGFRGLLIPRMTQAQRVALGTATQALTVYQTDGVPGFYYVEYGQWNRMDIGANNWDLFGNDVAAPATDFFGTRNDVDLVFKTNNAQVMRVEGTPGARYVRVGASTAAPAEQLEVEGAIRIFNLSPGSWAATNPNIKFAAGNTQGTIMFRPSGTGPVVGDSLQATFAPPGFPAQQNRDILMWNGHWGNINGTAPANLAAANANAGGWNRLENEYEERFTKAYTQPGTPTCGAGNAELSFGSVLNSSATTPVNAATALLMNPFKYDLGQRRWRAQYMFLKSELNVETNQLGGNTTATGGLCAGSAINQIGFWVDQAIIANNPQRNLPITVTVKHAPLGVNNLTAGFDNSVDPSAGCVNNNALLFPAVGAAGWRTFAISPFTWDGVRNVIVEIAVSGSFGGGGLVLGGLPVRYTNTGTNLTYSSYTSPPYPAPNTPPCNPATPTTNLCGPNNVATALGNCNNNGGAFGATIYRPVIRFGGIVATASGAATSGNDSYLWYNGGLVVEGTSLPPWGRQVVPYHSFKGPGTISAENGLFDNSVRLNDYILDRYFDGPTTASGSTTDVADRHFGLAELDGYIRRERHLPTMKGRDEWKQENGFSLGDLTNQLWATAETHALYLGELHQRLGVLEVLATDRPLTVAELEEVRTLIASDQQFSKREKRRLLALMEGRVLPVSTTRTP